MDNTSASIKVWSKGQSTTISGGESFALCDDGELLAVLADGHLSVMNLDGTNSQRVASNVSWFQWRPGTHDLVYSAYLKDSGMFQWRLYRAGQRELLLGEGRFPPSVSPSGEWLVSFVEGKDLRAMNLNSQQVQVRLGGPQGFLGWSWAGSDVIAFLEDWRRVVLLSVGTGERSAFLESEVELASWMEWSADWTMMAVPTRADTLTIWSKGGLRGVCAGRWRPLGWSRSGRYLVMDMDADKALHILDTSRLDDCSPMKIPGIWERYLEWHPSEDVLLASLSPTSNGVAQVEVWSLSSGQPELLGVIGNGKRASWLAPR